MRHQAAWVITFDLKRSPEEDLTKTPLQPTAELLEDGFFFAMAASPVCASFSQAILRRPAETKYTQAECLGVASCRR